MISNDLVENRYQSLRTLGVCWVIYGIIRLAAALWLAFFSNTASMMFGALLSRVAHPFTMMSEFHFVYTLIVVWSVVCGVLGLLGGLALLAGQGSGRGLVVVAAFLSLSEIPLGIALGIYTLIVLLPWSKAPASTVVARDRAADLHGHASAT